MFSYFAKASLFTQLQFIFARWGVSGRSRASTCARERAEKEGERERGSADSWKLTAATRENCAAAQEKQLTMLQVAVAAAPTPPPCSFCLLQAVAIVPGYGSAIALLKILMLQSLLVEWAAGWEWGWLPCICSLRHTHASTRRRRSRSSIASSSSSSSSCAVANCGHFPYPIQVKRPLQCLPEVCFAWLGLHFPAWVLCPFCLLLTLLPFSLSVCLSTYWQLPRPLHCYVNAFPCCCSAYP